MKKKVIIPANMPDAELIKKYKEALDTAVKFATVHNVKPIRGSTVVFCNVSEATRKPCKTAKGMGSVRTIHEIGILLGLMCKYMCEDCDFRIFSSAPTAGAKCHLKVELKDGTILDNMHTVLDSVSQLGTAVEFPFDYMEDLIRERKKIDQLIILSDEFIAPGHEGILGNASEGDVARTLKKISSRN